MTPRARQLLLLWDIDGTLLQRASVEHAQALREAVEDVHEVSGLADITVDYAGRTDEAITRDWARAAGVPADQIESRSPDVRRAACRAYDEYAPDDLSANVAPGITELLDELAGLPERFRMSLLTGNFEPIARLKLARAGIDRDFPVGQGAFGSDAEERGELPPIARARAAGDGTPWPRERTLIIGDTPRDILAARADGLKCIAVATGAATVDQLADADWVAPDAHEVARVLRTLE